MKPVYIIGHKNPDVDSVAAAISYKIYKQSTDKGVYIAAAASELKDELKNILDHLEFEHPLVLSDIGTTVEDLLEEERSLYISADTTLIELGNIMRNNNIKTVPVLDEKQRFLGLITIGDVAMIYLEALGSGRDIDNSPEVLRQVLAKKADSIMKSRNLVLFEKDEKVEEAKKMMLSTRFRNYPVVDDENRYWGMISRYNLLQMKRKQVILVDHNEKQQAVDGVEEADILEIIDHHRVGDLQTIFPIYFHNEPVGSTSTLIAEKFIANKVFMANNVAALLMSGIMTDTMIFKSPTTTAKDKRVAQELQRICGLDPVEWGKKLFAESSRVDKQTDLELISEDLKEYVSGSTMFAISQVETIDLDQFAERRKHLVATMEELCVRKGYALMCLMVTDIFEEGTDLIIAGELSSLVEEEFQHDHVKGGIFLKGVLSRKKQVVPVIYEMLRKQMMM
ncbi:MAG TPA: putative manganese-dependent inorganic diphosphatase [Syntrophomonas sp.]|nr:putative manganese-dependent inorganic diphosphatase [Syntrophomonas sp.]